MNQSSYLKILLPLSAILALCVVMLGAYTRLTDAGLGCPDWPGCYGHLTVPETPQSIHKAQLNFPSQTIEPQKAWTEMIHRYLAGSLGLLILYIGSQVWQYKRLRGYVYLLVLLLLFQVCLGMWTVTLKLLPIVVMGHLLGGIAIFSLLSCLWSEHYNLTISSSRGHGLAGLALCACVLQVALGGWVSANYAGLSCLSFPSCHGRWWLSSHWYLAFNPLASLGLDHQGGLLSHIQRADIQMVHRYGALALTVLLGYLLFFLRQHHKSKVIYLLGYLSIVLLLVQIGLGLINALYWLPLPAAVAHNGVGALLIADLAVLYRLLKRAPR